MHAYGGSHPRGLGSRGIGAFSLDAPAPLLEADSLAPAAQIINLVVRNGVFGVTINFDGLYPAVTSLVPAGPASLAGVRVGALLRSVGGRSTKGLSLQQVMQLIAGAAANMRAGEGPMRARLQNPLPPGGEGAAGGGTVGGGGGGASAGPAVGTAGAKPAAAAGAAPAPLRPFAPLPMPAAAAAAAAAAGPQARAHAPHALSRPPLARAQAPLRALLAATGARLLALPPGVRAMAPPPAAAPAAPASPIRSGDRRSRAQTVSPPARPPCSEKLCTRPRPPLAPTPNPPPPSSPRRRPRPRPRPRRRAAAAP